MSALPNGTAEVKSAQDGLAGLSVNGTSEVDANPGAIVAVGSVKNVSLPAPDLSKVRSVDTHTKALGVIQPPTDLRAIIDKSATFVAKNGRTHCWKRPSGFDSDMADSQAKAFTSRMEPPLKMPER